MPDMPSEIPNRLDLAPIAEKLAEHRAKFGTVPDLHMREAAAFLDDCLALLFPHLSHPPIRSEREIEARMTQLVGRLRYVLCESLPEDCDNADQVAQDFVGALPGIAEAASLDAGAIFEGDPAAGSLDEVILAYPGFYAIVAYRIAHMLFEQKVTLFARLIAEHAHWVTGIDIHPGAKIGRSFAVDHGTGVVIGETAVIGDNVRIYQGVTIGALKVARSERAKKRHPTIEDNVVIYSGATILGGRTEVGHDTIIGGNVWLTKSVPPYSRLMYKSLDGDQRATPELDRPDDYVI